MKPDDPVLSVDDLADQVAQILDFFGLSRVMCMGVTAGAYILTLFAIKYSCRVLGLILVSPLCQGPCWIEWLYNKVKFLNLLVILESKKKGVGTWGRAGTVVILFLLKDPLIFIGENSPFHHESLHMTSKLDRRYTALVEVQHCGSVVTEEQPDAMLIPLEYFLMGYGFYIPSQYSLSPRSPLSPTCISPELFSPESMGLKLKPITTRILLYVL